MTGAEGYDMYKIPPFEDLAQLDKNDRAGEFVHEYHTKHSFNEEGRGIHKTFEESRKIVKGAFAYADEQETLFQEKLAAIAAKKDAPTP